MSTANNNIVREICPNTLIADALPFLSSSVSFNQGDLLALDTTAHVLKALTGTAADSGNLLGVAPVTIVSGKLKSSYQGTAVDAAESAVSISGPLFGVVASFTLKTGDTINPGQMVYQDAGGSADPQTVTVTLPVGATAIGMYQGYAITSAPAGTKVQVLVGHNYQSSIV